MSKSQKLRIGLLLVLLGFFVSQWVEFSPVVLLSLCAGSILLTCFSRLWKIFGLLWILSFTYALWRGYEPDNPLSVFKSQNITLQGTVTSFPDQRISNNRVSVQIQKAEDQSIKNSSVLLITEPEILLHYGTEIRLKGVLKKPRNFQDFDYQKYLDRFGISHIIQNPENIEILSHQKGSPIFRMAEKLRSKLEKNLEQNLSSPHSTIATGILLGVKKELPPPIKTDFQNSGLMHILVVSGFNISVIMIVCNYLFCRFGPRINLVLSILVVGFFVLMTGAEAPVVRAAIMGGLVGMALSSGQFSESKNVLLLSAVIMGIINPKVVQADLGFFFSFAATAGIILLVPRLTPYFHWLTNRWEFRNIFLVTLSSQIAVFPIQTYFFGKFPTGGLLANQLTEPVIPVAMLFSGIVATVGFLPELAVKLLMIPAWMPLQALLSVANIFSEFPVLPVPKTISVISGLGLLCFFLKENLQK